MKGKIYEKEDLARLFGIESNSTFDVVDYDRDSKFHTTLFNSVTTSGNVAMIGLCLKGRIDMLLDGFLYEVRQGNMMLTMPGSIMRIAAASDDFGVRLLLAKTKPQMQLINTLSSYQDMLHHPIVSLSSSEKSLLLSLFEYVGQCERGTSNFYRNDIVNKVFALLCYELGNIYRRRFALRLKVTQNEMIFNTFIDLVSRHFTEHRDLEFFAAQMRLSKKSLTDRIVRATTKTPSAWIDKMVVDQAQSLLATSNLSVGELSERLGFASPSIFCRFYKRQTGITPLEYRKQVYHNIHK